MAKTMVGIFHDLTANRREARLAQMRFVVVSLKKDGHPRKVMAEDMQLSATRTRAEAEVRKATMEHLNPGKQFVVVELEVASC